jgi:hypothetical protein
MGKVTLQLLPAVKLKFESEIELDPVVRMLPQVFPVLFPMLKPLGNLSLKPTPVSPRRPLGLVIVMESVDERPNPVEAGVNEAAIVGGMVPACSAADAVLLVTALLDVTVSESW